MGVRCIRLLLVLKVQYTRVYNSDTLFQIFLSKCSSVSVTNSERKLLLINTTCPSDQRRNIPRISSNSPRSLHPLATRDLIINPPVSGAATEATEGGASSRLFRPT